MSDLLKYEKLRILGRGTFGEAWLVQSRVSKRHYVLKEMNTGGWEDADKDKSLNEVNILSRCNHLNIIRYVGAYRTHKNQFTEKILIVMEFAEGGDLAAVIKRQREVYKQFFPEEKILNWLVQISFGLQYIHKKNILHRDLKSQNIFLTKQNIIKIGDFGISKSLAHTRDLAHTAIGTPHYLSPEICQRQPYNHKSDMWSLGCVLYELCALKLAFPEENFVALIHSICRGSYTPISNQYYSIKLSDLIQVLLRPVPARRPSVEQLLSCSTLENEVATYLTYVNQLKESVEGGSDKERKSSQSSKEDESRGRVGSQGSTDGGYGSGPISA
eukprot:TRINITY_DN3409_c0_g1_i4.p1 TRINITY_DN3409_c0_g1~~TRINITY_DN3409_c0_g1_i4.p1  ORF type:complete len:329 (-),score=47.86 TRINITY_DN3409_c0_g1_i4:194-1180(-)